MNASEIRGMAPWGLREMVAASLGRTRHFGLRAVTVAVWWASNPLGAYRTAPGASRHETAKVNDEPNIRKAKLHKESFLIALDATSCRFLGFSPGEGSHEKSFSICSGIVASLCFSCLHVIAHGPQAFPLHANR